MQTIKVDKERLLETLKENRDNHHAKYLAACEGYRAKAIELAEQCIDALVEGDVIRVIVNLPLPEDHTEDYNTVIAMLDWDQGDTYELSQSDFEKYVNDDWGWKAVWTQTNSAYGVN